MKNIKKYRDLAILIIVFFFSMYVNAVFEGRNEQVKEYTGVRQQVEMQEYNTQNAAGIGFDDPKKEEATGYDVPFTDSSMLVLGFCSLISSIYYLGRKNKQQDVEYRIKN